MVYALAQNPTLAGKHLWSMWVAIEIGLWLATFGFVLALCRAAGDADRSTERAFHDGVSADRDFKRVA